MLQLRKKRLTRMALTLSVVLLAMWVILGTGTSLAWFSDTSPVVQNTFHIGELDLDVYYKNDTVTEYAPVEIDTNLFGDDALYEPGYTKVVYLKIENSGEIDFNYKLSVDVASATVAQGVLGNEIYLPNYLRYGVLFGADEETLTRDVARTLATLEFPEEQGPYPLNIYSAVDSETVTAGEARYAALIVYMPEAVGNTANYRGDTAPTVDLGLTVFAQQADAPLT